MPRVPLARLFRLVELDHYRGLRLVPEQHHFVGLEVVTHAVGLREPSALEQIAHSLLGLFVSGRG